VLILYYIDGISLLQDGTAAEQGCAYIILEYIMESLCCKTGAG